MKITRRKFLKYSAIAGAAAVLPWKIAMREAYAQYGINSPNLQKFIQPLRSVGPAGVFNGTLQQSIPVGASDGSRGWGATTATHYTMEINQFTDQLHPGIGPAGTIATWGATTLWGYNPTGATQRHLGGVIATARDAAVQITFQNNLPPTHILPLDTLGVPYPLQNRTAVHLHGGLVPWISDGGPFDWWAPNGEHGLSFVNNQVLRPAEFVAGTIPANEAEYYYPNGMSARLVWYHDHAHDITRNNAYAGIATGYVITDAAEAGLVAQGVPGPLDAKTFYLIFQDKVFNPDGSLFYASIYNTALFGPLGVPSFGGARITPLPNPSIVPEFFGDTILVNGTAYPYMEVEPRRYRFRMLNACNSRFLNPRLVYAKSNVLTNVNSTEPTANAPAASFLQIATEGGFLPTPVLYDGKPNSPKILMAPAERADVIVDFSKVPVNSVLILYNDAPGPFPGGGSVFDYYPGNPKTPTSIPGFGPNSRTLLQLRVVPATGTADPPLTLALPPLDPPALVTQAPGVPIVPVINRTTGTASVPGVTNATFRSLTLNEGFDQWGRLAQYIGTNTQVAGTAPGFFGRRYMEDAATEVMNNGATEIWEIANLTADTHPLHFHLVNVQVLARQPFNVRGYAGVPNLRGKPVAPDPNELGWKETVRMNPGEVIWVIMKFELPVVPFAVPPSQRLAQAPSNLANANEFVWHCHILEHEEHDMMRPIAVLGDNPNTGLAVQPTTATVTGAASSPVTLTIFGGKPAYTIAAIDPNPNLYVTAFNAQVGVATLTVPPGTAPGTVVYTITDSATPTPASVQFTLTIV